MDNLTLWNVLAMLMVAMGAGFVQTSIGFGFAIVALPFLVMFLPLQQAVAIMAILGTCCYIRVTYKLREHMDFKIVYIPLIASTIGRIIGMQFLMGTKAEYIKILLGLSFIIISIYFAFFKSKIKIKYNIKNGLIFGLISGIFGGMFNISGPPIVLYYMAGNMLKEKYMATLQLYFLLSTSFSVMLHISYGNVNISTLSFSIIGLLGVITGSAMGSKVFNKLNTNTFNYAVYIFLAFSGVYTVLTSILAIV